MILSKSIFLILILLNLNILVNAVSNDVFVDAKVNATYKLELLELTADADKKLQILHQENINDPILENIFEKMKVEIKEGGFSDIISVIKDQYGSNPEKLNQIYRYISVTNKKTDLYLSEYSKVKDLHKELNSRIDYIYEVNNLMIFIEQEVSKYSDNEEIVTNKERESLELTKKYFDDDKYDLAKSTLTDIKVQIDIRALRILYTSKQIINKLEKDGFSVALINDIFDSGVDEISVVYFDEILEDPRVAGDQEFYYFIQNISLKFENKSRNSFEGIDYISIKSIASNIDYISTQIYRINQTMGTVQVKLNSYQFKGINISMAENEFKKAIISFDQERYDEAESTLNKANSDLELEATRMAVRKVLSKESINLLSKYKTHSIVLVILLIIFGPILLRRLRISINKKKLDNLNIEYDVLLELLRKAQIDRYQKGVIDHAIYQIKLDQYTEKISTIKSKIPVINDIIKRLNKNPTITEKIYFKFSGFIIKVFHIRNKKKKIFYKKLVKIKNSNLSEYFSYRKKDFIFLAVVIILWALINNIMQPVITFVKFAVAFSFMAFFITLVYFMIRKFGIILLLLLLGVFLIKSLPDLNGLGTKAYLIVLITGGIFELMQYIIYKLKIKNPVDIILVTVINLAFIPLWTGLLLSARIVASRWMDILNLILIDFFVGLIGALIAFVLWFHLRTTKFIVKYKYGS